VRQIADLHGGALDIADGLDGHGVTFRLRLPAT
jgi:signal transduction histidine kinase